MGRSVQGRAAAQVWSWHGRAGAEEANSAGRWAQRRRALKRVGQRGARQREAQQVAARQGWTRSGRVGEDCRPGPGAASGWAAAQQKTRRLASATAEARRPSPRREAKRAKQSSVARVNANSGRNGRSARAGAGQDRSRHGRAIAPQEMWRSSCSGARVRSGQTSARYARLLARRLGSVEGATAETCRLRLAM